jgi:hypothetical protein
MGDVIVKGSIAVREVPESGSVEQAEGTRRTVVQEGDYALLAAAQPARGDNWADMPNWTVDTSHLTRKRGGLGKLVITLVPYESFYGSFAEQELRSRIEIDFVQYERPILMHPTLNEGASNYKAIHLRRWMDQGCDPFFKYRDAQGEQTLTEEEQEWAQLILKGVEGYLEFAPVVSRIRTYKGRPDVEAPGKRENPPEGGVSGYEYLKTADRLTQNEDRTWTRTEQWTGALKWEELLYESAEGD